MAFDMPKLTYLIKNNYHSVIDTRSVIPYKKNPSAVLLTKEFLKKTNCNLPFSTCLFSLCPISRDGIVGNRGLRFSSHRISSAHAI
jgi:hypothetical protein